MLVVPTVEWEAGDWIGTVSVYSNAENTDETLDDATCEAEGVPAPCARTNIELRAWPRDLGNVDIQVVAEVGTDIFETGICNFGAVAFRISKLGRTAATPLQASGPKTTATGTQWSPALTS